MEGSTPRSPRKGAQLWESSFGIQLGHSPLHAHLPQEKKVTLLRQMLEHDALGPRGSQTCGPRKGRKYSSSTVSGSSALMPHLRDSVGAVMDWESTASEAAAETQVKRGLTRLEKIESCPYARALEPDVEKAPKKIETKPREGGGPVRRDTAGARQLQPRASLTSPRRIAPHLEDNVKSLIAREVESMAEQEGRGGGRSLNGRRVLNPIHLKDNVAIHLQPGLFAQQPGALAADSGAAAAVVLEPEPVVLAAPPSKPRNRDKKGTSRTPREKGSSGKTQRPAKTGGYPPLEAVKGVTTAAQLQNADGWRANDAAADMRRGLIRNPDALEDPKMRRLRYLGLLGDGKSGALEPAERGGEKAAGEGQPMSARVPSKTLPTLEERQAYLVDLSASDPLHSRTTNHWGTRNCDLYRNMERTFISSQIGRSKFDVLNNVRPVRHNGLLVTPRGRVSRSDCGLELDPWPGLKEATPFPLCFTNTATQAVMPIPREVY